LVVFEFQLSSLSKSSVCLQDSTCICSRKFEPGKEIEKTEERQVQRETVTTNVTESRKAKKMRKKKK